MSKIEIIRRPKEEDWARCYRLALGTEGKGTDKVPTPAWMEKILKAEHSPIRTLMWTVRMYDVPYWVAMHLVRHKYGVEWYVQSQRNDRQSRYDRNKAQQGPAGQPRDADHGCERAGPYQYQPKAAVLQGRCGDPAVMDGGLQRHHRA